MKAYTFEVRDSDGNDCRVYDVIVEAESRELASDKLWAYLKECYPKDESDGAYGTYHACDCTCKHRKRSICTRWHGGLTTNEDAGDEYGPTEHDSLAAALDARKTYYHTLVTLEA